MSVPFICYEDLYGPVNTYISEHLYFLKKNPKKPKHKIMSKDIPYSPPLLQVRTASTLLQGIGSRGNFPRVLVGTSPEEGTQKLARTRRRDMQVP